MTEIRIHENIFEQYSSFRRGIVVAKKVRNHGHSQELEAKLNQAIAQAAKQAIDLKTDPRIIVWNQAHQQFGSKGEIESNDFRDVLIIQRSIFYTIARHSRP